MCVYLQVWSVKYNPTGSKIMSAGDDRAIHVYDCPMWITTKLQSHSLSRPQHTCKLFFFILFHWQLQHLYMVIQINVFFSSCCCLSCSGFTHSFWSMMLHDIFNRMCILLWNLYSLQSLITSNQNVKFPDLSSFFTKLISVCPLQDTKCYCANSESLMVWSVL